MGETEKRPQEPEHADGSQQTGVAYLWYLTVIAVTTTVGSILLATVLSPGFAWRENALSNLGVVRTDAGTATTAVLFNGGLVIGGVIGVVVTVTLYRRVTGSGDQVVAVLAGAALTLMGLVGVFTQGHPLHFPVAVSFFLLVSVVMWVDGGVRYRGGSRRRAGLAVAGGVANVLCWVVWVTVVTDPSSGLAIPEMVGAGLFGVWLLAATVRLSGR
ncbi:MAG: putative membrane protein [halophilic archaeon J07HX64]|jgi:Predicted membrane protein|nr:MAG: putative membrane protein [halophilic archaeon J07HX64]